jgi:exodeoxyribonuclease-3
MKIFTWNVNGIRSVFRTTFKDWLAANDPDIVCLQEIKADSKELADEFSQIDGYYAYFNSSSLKKGHSGTAVYTKIKPLSVETKLAPLSKMATEAKSAGLASISGCEDAIPSSGDSSIPPREIAPLARKLPAIPAGTFSREVPGIERFDDEGRCIKLTFKDFILFNFYIPNGSRDQHEIPYKLKVYEKLFPIFQSLANENVILTGDFNIAHTKLDVCNAKQNENNTMFTPVERAQITKLLNCGYVDAFRQKYPEKQSYTWWPYMRDLRERDIGWRIDYFFITKSLERLVQDVITQREVLGSDHGPCGMMLNKSVDTTERPVYAKTKSPGMLF